MSEEVKESPSSETPDNVLDFPQIDPGLMDSIVALRALATVHNLLNDGGFRIQFHEPVMKSIAFIKLLHSDMMAKCLAHEDAHKVPDLAPFLKKEEPTPEVEVPSEQA